MLTEGLGRGSWSARWAVLLCGGFGVGFGFGGAAAQTAYFSMSGWADNPNDQFILPIELTRSVSAFAVPPASGDVLELRTWHHDGGINAAGDAIPTAGPDPVLRFVRPGVPFGVILGSDDNSAGAGLDALVGLTQGDNPIGFTLNAGTYQGQIDFFDPQASGPWVADLRLTANAGKLAGLVAIDGGPGTPGSGSPTYDSLKFGTTGATIFNDAPAVFEIDENQFVGITGDVEVGTTGRAELRFAPASAPQNEFLNFLSVGGDFTVKSGGSVVHDGGGVFFRRDLIVDGGRFENPTGQVLAYGSDTQDQTLLVENGGIFTRGAGFDIGDDPNTPSGADPLKVLRVEDTGSSFTLTGTDQADGLLIQDNNVATVSAGGVLDVPYLTVLDGSRINVLGTGSTLHATRGAEGVTDSGSGVSEGELNVEAGGIADFRTTVNGEPLRVGAGGDADVFVADAGSTLFTNGLETRAGGDVAIDVVDGGRWDMANQTRLILGTTDAASLGTTATLTVAAGGVASLGSNTGGNASLINASGSVVLAQNGALDARGDLQFLGGSDALISDSDLAVAGDLFVSPGAAMQLNGGWSITADRLVLPEDAVLNAGSGSGTIAVNTFGGDLSGTTVLPGTFVLGVPDADLPGTATGSPASLTVGVGQSVTAGSLLLGTNQDATVTLGSNATLRATPTSVGGTGSIALGGDAAAGNAKLTITVGAGAAVVADRSVVASNIDLTLAGGRIEAGVAGIPNNGIFQMARGRVAGEGSLVAPDGLFGQGVTFAPISDVFDGDVLTVTGFTVLGAFRSFDGGLAARVDSTAAADRLRVDGILSIRGGTLSLDMDAVLAQLDVGDTFTLVSSQGAVNVFNRVTGDAPLTGQAITQGRLAVLYDAQGVHVRLSLPGDANLNGLIEQADLDQVLTNWGRNNLVSGRASWITGDFNGNGRVEQADLDLVLTNWGSRVAPSFALNPALVPEPATAVLTLLAAPLLRRRRPA